MASRQADKLTQLGPRPTIASLSLGATRTFRLRPAAERGSRGRKSSHGQKAPEDHTSMQCADVVLPHNTLVIMWPPTQEEWRHEVEHCCQMVEL